MGEMPMKSALVTGAAGLLGRATVDALADEGVDVHALVRSGEQAFRDDVVFHEADLANPLSDASLPARVDAVFHLAQAREFRDFPGSAPSVFSINVASTAFLLDYAFRIGATNFVYASSGGVYRGRPGGPLAEDEPVQSPEDLGYYLATKLSCESLVASYSGRFATAALRYFFIYGPRQERSMLIPRLYDRVRLGEPLALQGEDGMRINPVHVSDAAAATVAASRLEGSTTVNIAGPQTLSLREIGELFGRDLDREPVFEQGEGTASDLIASTAKMAELLRPPVIGLSDALADIRG
jgi:nucleoside-diphosphate-sugar epimerase